MITTRSQNDLSICGSRSPRLPEYSYITLPSSSDTIHTAFIMRPRRCGWVSGTHVWDVSAIVICDYWPRVYETI